MAEEATINPDGSTKFESSAGGEESFEQGGFDDANAGDGASGEPADVESGIDPAIYLLIFLVVGALVALYIRKKRNEAEEEDDFFAALDGEKFNLRLPEEAENYRQIKEKCEAAGYEPGAGVPADVQTNPNNPHRILAQALMKRAIADIPLVQHIQKESPAMNKLYSKSMCSVKQWRNYQAAEAMVSAEVDEVRAEADELEPGWSELIWRQAMQYHGMLKARHEQEQAALNRAKEEAMKKKAEAMKKKKEVDDAKAKEVAAEKAAQELLKAEERKKDSDKAFNGGGMKKGFLDAKKKKKAS
mmetsp:Transcript_6903/g.10182  ORF Transcript_6903/g.10182 Transcript_6903/m.10182 type:complete len:301 (+) Transcript_6903:146-1048(+)|eukprot:CAMPEP_0196811920 /NCGR_PEP_ID=MMETSP1362-20130617/20137_1 /TAXON_ID=163516 /ORGANISM="Leptocylindrus danicus, Strain CCMP1856" /LENGTH=300 /DNA_ID=CAMNT_0042187325 /DNA_START=134 /DNA_END=1036 /DNA_ORIENTATION=-